MGCSHRSVALHPKVVLRGVVTIAVQLAVVASVSVAAAQGSVSTEFFEGARSMSVAGASRALGTTNDAIYVNPAGMVFSKVYSIEAGYLDDLHGQERTFNSSVMDTQAGPVAAGLGYNFIDRNLAGDLNQVVHRGDLAIAARAHDQIGIGVTLRYQDVAEAIGDETIEGGGYNIFTLDAGVAWQSDFGLSLGLAGYNLTNSDRPEFPISWGAGIGFGYDWFSIEGDIRYNAQKGRPRFAGGAGVLIYDMIPIRAGVAYDRLDESVHIAIGVGYQQENVALDVTWRQRVVHGDLPDDALGDRMLALAVRTTFE